MSKKIFPLRTIRKQSGHTQQQVADTIGTYRERFAYWENGLQVPRLESQIKIAVFFNMALVELQKRCEWPLTPHVTVNPELAGGLK
jgi:DNA-binding XRE family transcriptional regulator